MIYATPETNPTFEQVPLGELPSIFLAGSIDMGGAEDWQVQATKQIAAIESTLEREFIVMNPRRDNWDSSWGQDSPELAHQINWELDAMELVDAVLFYLGPTTKSPVTMLEIGLQAGQNIAGFLNKSVVFCSPGFWRKANVDIVCETSRMIRVDNFEDLISEASTIAQRNFYRLQTFSKNL